MGFNIAALREQKHMTQEELSIKANVSRAIISGLESGRTKQTTIKTLRKLADALGVDISSFFVNDA